MLMCAEQDVHMGLPEHARSYREGSTAPYICFTEGLYVMGGISNPPQVWLLSPVPCQGSKTSRTEPGAVGDTLLFLAATVARFSQT